MDSISAAIIALAGLVLLVAAVCDLRRFEIPDSLSVLLIMLAFGYGALQTEFFWASHLASGVCMFAIGAGLFALGWMGGGDVKLLAAVACWTGLGGLPSMLSMVLLAGGVLALVLIVARRLVPSVLPAGARLPGPLVMDAPLPYAVAILGGAVVWAMQSGLSDVFQAAL